MILGKPDDIFDLKKGFYKLLKNVPAVSNDWLRIAWKCMKVMQIK